MSEVLDQQHPLLAALTQARAVLASVGEVQAHFMASDDLGVGLREVVALEAQVAEAKARLLVAADAPPDDSGSLAARAGLRDVTAWLHVETATGVRSARAQLRLAHALDTHPATAAAMRAGEVSAEQAAVILHAVDALPADLEPDIGQRAEQVMIADAATFDPKALAVLGRRVLQVVAPDLADEIEGQALEDQERRARQATRLTLRHRGDGTYHLSARLPELSAALLASFLGALTNPRRTPAWAEQASAEARIDSDLWWSLPGATKLGHAFCEFLERINPADLPVHGTTPVGLVITMDLDRLRSDLASASLHGPDGDLQISASEARRLACTAGLLPAVLDSNSEPLDLGRSARLFTAAQKRALMITHRTCMAEGCEAPAEHTEMHHEKPWSAGGPTNLDNAVLLCNRDHHRAHDRRWSYERVGPVVQFTRRC